MAELWPSTRRWVDVTGALLLVALIVLMLQPLFGVDWYANDEVERYPYRLEAFFLHWSGDNPYPRWIPELAGGHGYPLFVFFNPLFVLAGLPFRLLGYGPVLSVKLAVVTFVLLGAWRSVALGRRLWGYASAGYLFAGVYLTVPYTLSNLYARGDLAEFGATMLYPIIVDAYLAYRDRGGLGRALLLALSYGALVPMHAFSALLFTLGGGLVVAWLAYVERTSPRRLGGAVAACALGVGMASFYWIPVFAELGTVSTEALFHADAIAQTAISVVGLVDHEARSAVAGRWISYGPWVVALAVLGLMPRGRTPAYSRRPWVGALFVLGLLAGLLSTHAMVWF